jgi:uncharacterized damage-inducible protein DinB
MSEQAGGLDILPIWARLNDGLIRLVDSVPDDRLDWAPQAELYTFRRILQHIANARDVWLSRMNDGAETPAVDQTTVTKHQIQQAYRRTWARLEPVMRDPAMLAGMHGGGGNYAQVSGHWIAFHLLEHDVHHRADVFHYLALLGIAMPDVDTP